MQQWHNHLYESPPTAAFRNLRPGDLLDSVKVTIYLNFVYRKSSPQTMYEENCEPPFSFILDDVYLFYL